MILGMFKNYKIQQKYNTFDRTPFFELARSFIPEGNEVKILDIGAGASSFVDQLQIGKQIYLLDGNIDTIKALKARYTEGLPVGHNIVCILHQIPSRLPFADRFVDYIHCSHVIEHLNYDDCYSFIQDIDRILKPGGILVLSAPTFHPDFYNDFSHIKPYHPSVFLKYLVYGIRESSTAQPISGGYAKLALVFRYTLSTPTTYTGSDNRVLDFTFYLWRQVKIMLGIRVYQRSGYTLVLRKGGA